MLTCIVGTLLLGVIVVGGIYLYYKVEVLDREISKHRDRTWVESDGDT